MPSIATVVARTQSDVHEDFRFAERAPTLIVYCFLVRPRPLEITCPKQIPSRVKSHTLFQSQNFKLTKPAPPTRLRTQCKGCAVTLLVADETSIKRGLALSCLSSFERIAHTWQGLSFFTARPLLQPYTRAQPSQGFRRPTTATAG